MIVGIIVAAVIVSAIGVIIWVLGGARYYKMLDDAHRAERETTPPRKD